MSRQSAPSRSSAFDKSADGGHDDDDDDAPKKKKQKRGDQEYKEERGEAAALEKAYKRSPDVASGRLVFRAWSAFYDAVEKKGGYNTLKEGAPRKYYTSRRSNKAAMDKCIRVCCGGDDSAFFSTLKEFPSVYGKVYTCTHKNT